MKAPKVSVIVPCFNQGKYLKECLDSVLEQTFQDFEVIIIDDGSTDNSWSVIQKYASQYPNVIAIHQKNCGVIATRNTAIQKAKGEYIFPLDGDDKISPTVLEKAVAILDRNSKVGIVGGKTEFFGIKQGEWKLPPYQFPDILRGNCLVCSCMFRKSDWEKVGGYNPNMKYGWEDYDFWLSLIEWGKQVYQFDETFLYYRQLKESRTTRLKDKRQKQMIQQIILNHPKLYQKYPECKKQLTCQIFSKKDYKYIFIKALCLITPVKSWRHKLRDIYRKGG